MRSTVARAHMFVLAAGVGGQRGSAADAEVAERSSPPRKGRRPCERDDETENADDATVP